MHRSHIDRRQALRLMTTTAVAGTLPSLPGTSLAQAGAWRPSQNISYTVGVAPGGSVDLYARGIKQVLDNLKLLNGQTMVVDNKPGAAGLLSLQSLLRSRGNGHQLASFHTGAIAGQVTGILKADLREFTPVSMMVEETTLVAVRADSPLKTARDLVDALKRDPAATNIAVAPIRGQNTHLAIVKPLKLAGVDVAKLTIVPFRSSGESVAALLGGHVDVVSATAPTITPLVQAGKLRMIASAAPERGTGPLANVLTWREQGIDADYVSYNGVLLPPGVDAEQIRFWEQALKKVAAAPEWIALVEKSGNKPIFKGYVDSRRYMQSETIATQELVAALGAGAL